MKSKKGLSMSLLTMIVIFVAVLALSIVLFNPGGVIEIFVEIINKLRDETSKGVNFSSGNKGLHIHLGGDNGQNLYEFHLFNSLEHEVNKELGTLKTNENLVIKEWKKDKCTIFISDSSNSPTSLWFIKAIGGNRIYYVNAGVLIQDGIKNMEEVLSIYEGKCECIKEKKERGEYTLMSSEGCGTPLIKDSHVCWGVKMTIEAAFNTALKDMCSKYKKLCPKDGCCHLLYKTDLGNYIYRIKYGIICGYKDDSDEAYWWACTEDNDGMEISAQGKNYVCEFKEGIGKWKEK